MAALCAILLVSVSCDAQRPASAPQSTAPNARTAQSRVDADAIEEGEVERFGPAETWDVQLMRGVKMGYVHTIRRPFQEDDQPRIEIDMTMKIGVARAGEANNQQMRLISVETPDGHLVRFRSDVDLGSGPMVVMGQIDGKTLQITQKGVAGSQQIDWPADAVGFSGIEASLRREPLKPGERREFTVLVPFLNQVAREELVGGGYEETQLLSGARTLLRVEVTTRLPGGVAVNETQWIDEQGEALKTRVASADQESFRATREVALAPPADGKLDLIRDLVVKPRFPAAGPPAKPLDQLPQASYRVTLQEDDPAVVFASGSTQQTSVLAPHQAQLTIWRAGPGHLPARSDLALEPPPGPAYLASSSLVQSDDVAVKELAAQVDRGAPGSAERASALATAVNQLISKKNFTQAFASAAEVARRREGDCTEHSVLLTAMARASGIPARVAVGLVYVDGLGGFGFHMWSEVYVDGHWLPLDATFGTMVGPGHLKLTDSPLSQGAEFAAFLSVARVLGQLTIELQP